MFATGTLSPRAHVAATLDYHLGNGIAEQIACPTRVLEAEEDMFFRGQPQELYDHLTCPRTFMRFSVADWIEVRRVEPRRDSDYGCKSGQFRRRVANARETVFPGHSCPTELVVTDLLDQRHPARTLQFDA
jgi:hypothetical protein